MIVLYLYLAFSYLFMIGTYKSAYDGRFFQEVDWIDLLILAGSPAVFPMALGWGLQEAL